MSKISLKKGNANKLSLKKVAPSLNNFRLEFSWMSGSKLDLDASALVCRRDSQGIPKLQRVEDVVFYNNKVDSARCVFAGEDQRDGTGDLETIEGILSKIPEDKDEIALILTIDDNTANTSQTFSLASEGKFELINADNGDVILDFDFLADDVKNSNILHVASIVREDDGWKVVGYGNGLYSKDGIAYALAQFGAESSWFE